MCDGSQNSVQNEINIFEAYSTFLKVRYAFKNEIRSPS